MFFFNIAVNIPNGGLITFGALIINNLGFDAQTSALLSMPNGVISSASGFLASYLAAKWQGRRTFVVMLAPLVPLLGTALVYALPRSSTGGQMFGLYLMYCYWAPYVTAISLPQANTAGSTKLENHRKDKKYGKAHQVEKENVDALVEVYQDLSDKKQEDFRYTH
ncbi:hypothetical protein V2G26_018441 [Clonostachys chloroleuca]